MLLDTMPSKFCKAAKGFVIAHLRNKNSLSTTFIEVEDGYAEPYPLIEF